MARKKKSIHNLLITGIADKGKAVGRTDDGQVIFVDGAIPGDRVDILVIRKKKSHSEAIVTGFVGYSDDRVSPSCRHFGVCGGCKWQNLSYISQLNHKYQTVRDSMRRIGKLDPDIVMPIIGCDDIFHYRNKLEYSFSSRRWITQEEASSDHIIDQPGALGFHRPGSFDKIVDIEQCLLQDDLSNEIRNFVRQFAHQNEFSFYDIKAQKGFLRNMIIRNTTTGEWMLILVFGHHDKDKIVQMMNAISNRFPQIISLNFVINSKVNDTIYDRDVTTWSGQSYITEHLRDVKYRIGPKSFFQTNPRQALRLFDIAVDFADLRPDYNVYDLYTGLGSIALFVSGKVSRVTGIEEIPEAIADANLNKEYNGINNATFYAGDVRDILNSDFISVHGKPDIVITDPPRAGMHEDVVNTLLDLRAPVIVYISCNPATQARDLALLSQKYEITSIQPIDMFPHTHHIESVAKLKLRI